MKKMYVLLIVTLLCVKTGALIYAEENTEQELSAAERQDNMQIPVDESAIDSDEALPDSPLQRDDSALKKTPIGRLVFTLGAAGVLNTDKNSAPSPVLFTVGAGARFPFYTNKTMILSVAPHGHFFASFYFWDKTRELVLPAEIEQRIAYVPAIMFDSPVLFHFPVKNSVFAAGLGPSFLLRFAARAINVASSEDAHIRLMNKWFWQNGRFFYPALHFSWDYIFPSGAAAGIGLKAYISTGGLVDNRGLDRSMIILSARLTPGQKR
ncbi:hypothetical protein V1L52_09115 [Treponema sp. HNW]|uniref:hypothetical protein n=1 Tax=Treponema sp. HNW TaxID=3116654 RepID=UPI003D108377